MKKFLFSLLSLLMLSLTSFAQSWGSSPVIENYEGSGHVIYFQLQRQTDESGTMATYSDKNAKVAAFIDGELRGVSELKGTGTRQNPFYNELWVRGSAADNGKTITLRGYAKANEYDEYHEYRMTETITYQDATTATYPSNAQKLTLTTIDGWSSGNTYMGVNATEQLNISFRPAYANELYLTDDQIKVYTWDEAGNQVPSNLVSVRRSGNIFYAVSGANRGFATVGIADAFVDVTVVKYATGFTLDTSNLEVFAGDQFSVSECVTPIPADADGYNMVYDVEDESILSIYSNCGGMDGTGNAYKPGTTKVVVKMYNFGENQPIATKEFQITVKQHVTGLEALTEEIFGWANGSTIDLKNYYNVLPDGTPTPTGAPAVEASNKACTYEIAEGGDDIVTIDANGILTPTGQKGECTIIVTSVDNAEASCEIKVYMRLAATSMTLSEDAPLVLSVGDSKRLEEYLTFAPEDCEFPSAFDAVIKPGEAEGVLDLYPNCGGGAGSLHAVKTGMTTAIISAFTPISEEPLTVEVPIVVASIESKNDFNYLYVGQQVSLADLVNVTPEAANLKLTYSFPEEDPNMDPNDVLSISADGTITLKAPGYAKVRVSAEANPEIFADVEIVVEQAVTELKVNPDNLPLVVPANENVELKYYYELLPMQATYQSVIPTLTEGEDVAELTVACAGYYDLIPKKPGTVTVQLSTENKLNPNEPLTGELTFTVVSLIESGLHSLYAGNTYSLNDLVVLDPANANITLGCSLIEEGANMDPNDVLSVSADGTITAKAEGYAEVRVYVVENPDIYVNVYVNVSQPVTGLEVLQESPIVVPVGFEGNLSDYYKLLPEGTRQDVEITLAEGEGVVELTRECAGSPEVIRALETGTATVQLSTENKLDPSHPFTGELTFVVAELNVDDDNPTLLIGAPLTNIRDYVIVTPSEESLTLGYVNRRDPNSTILSIADDGTITPLSPGSATIRVFLNENKDIYQDITFDVIQPVTDIVVNPNDLPTNLSIEDGAIDLTEYYALVPDNCQYQDVEINLLEGEDCCEITYTTDGPVLLTPTGSGKVMVEFVTENLLDPEHPITKTLTFNIGNTLEDILVEELDEDGDLWLYIGENGNLTITPYPEGALFEPELLTIECSDPEALNVDQYEGEFFYDALDTKDVTLTLTYGEGDNAIVKEINAHINLGYQLSGGWQWISSPYQSVTNSLEELFGEDLVEIRTQRELLYNDPNWGYVGDITGFSRNHYRVKMDESVEAYDVRPRGTIDRTNNITFSVRKGWNWVAYPYVQNLFLSSLRNDAGWDFRAGDVLKTKEDYAEYDDDLEEMDGSLYEVKAGEGLLYYTTEARTITLSPIDNVRPAMVRAKRVQAEKREKCWNYDHSRFQDNMAMTAVMEGLDFAEDYTIGAFVGGECRGEGVLKNGKWFITVHGTSGEAVTLRLKNKLDDATYQLDGEYTLTTKLGSIAEPIVLHTPEATAIDAIALDEDGVRVYNTQGMDVTAQRKHLPAGVYIAKKNGRATKVTLK